MSVTVQDATAPTVGFRAGADNNIRLGLSPTDAHTRPAGAGAEGAHAPPAPSVNLCMFSLAFCCAVRLQLHLG